MVFPNPLLIGSKGSINRVKNPIFPFKSPIRREKERERERGREGGRERE